MNWRIYWRMFLLIGLLVSAFSMYADGHQTLGALCAGLFVSIGWGWDALAALEDGQ